MINVDELENKLYEVLYEVAKVQVVRERKLYTFREEDLDKERLMFILTPLKPINVRRDYETYDEIVDKVKIPTKYDVPCRLTLNYINENENSDKDVLNALYEYFIQEINWQTLIQTLGVKGTVNQVGDIVDKNEIIGFDDVKQTTFDVLFQFECESSVGIGYFVETDTEYEIK